MGPGSQQTGGDEALRVASWGLGCRHAQEQQHGSGSSQQQMIRSHSERALQEGMVTRLMELNQCPAALGHPQPPAEHSEGGS